MRIFYLAIFFCVVSLYFCKSNSNKIDNLQVHDTVSKTDGAKESETPLLKAIEIQQGYMKSHNISKIFCYSRSLTSRKDTFSIDEIRDFDKQGRLTYSFSVNGSFTDTFWRRTYLYNSNGVVKRMSMKLENGQTVDEYYTYTKDGHLLNSFLMGSVYPSVDSFLYKYSADTVYKFYIDQGQIRPYPDIEILNNKSFVVKSIDHLPASSTPPYEVIQRIYADTCPIAKKEIINAGLSTARERIFKLYYY